MHAYIYPTTIRKGKKHETTSLRRWFESSTFGLDAAFREQVVLLGYGVCCQRYACPIHCHPSRDKVSGNDIWSCCRAHEDLAVYAQDSIQAYQQALKPEPINEWKNYGVPSSAKSQNRRGTLILRSVAMFQVLAVPLSSLLFIVTEQLNSRWCAEIANRNVQCCRHIVLCLHV